MTDTNRLKVLAESLVIRAGSAGPDISADVLGLIEEVEKLRADTSSMRGSLNANSKSMKKLIKDGTKVTKERDRLREENETLRRFAAEVYQVLGALDAPENVLDNASDAANGVPLRHETLLPFFAEDYEALRKDAARYRWLRDLPEDSPHEQIGNFPGWMWDDAIDKGMAEIQVTQPGATSSP